MMKFIKKYKWYIIGGIAVIGFYYWYMKRAYIGNDPNTGIPGKDLFHLYSVCSPDPMLCKQVGSTPPCIVGRCTNPDGTSCTGDPCVATGDLDKNPMFMGLNIQSPGGEMIVRQPTNRPLGVGS